MPIPPDRLNDIEVDPDQRPRRSFDEIKAEIRQQYEATSTVLCLAAGITVEQLKQLEMMHDVFTVHRAIRAYGFEFKGHLLDTEEEFLRGQQQDWLLTWQADH